MAIKEIKKVVSVSAATVTTTLIVLCPKNMYINLYNN